MTARRGRTTFGCLLGLLLVVTVIYFGVSVGEPYIRYYRYLDGMKQEAKFSARFTMSHVILVSAVTMGGMGRCGFTRVS